MSDVVAIIQQLAHLKVSSLTTLASMGGFLLQPNTTLCLLVNENQIAPTLNALRTSCQRRRVYIPAQLEVTQQGAANPVEVELGGGVIFMGEVELVEEF